jgi:hypothetical protein
MQQSTIIWNYPELDRLLHQRTGVVGRDLEARATRVMWAAKAQAGIRTGALKLSIHISHEREQTGQAFKVGSPLTYALVHHEGVKPRVIIARSGGVLRFLKRGSVIYTRVVKNPGVKPNRYLTDNLPLVLGPGTVTPGVSRIIDV